jgi:hypothetical protein
LISELSDVLQIPGEDPLDVFGVLRHEASDDRGCRGLVPIDEIER